MRNPEASPHLPSKVGGTPVLQKTVSTFWLCRALSQSSLVPGKEGHRRHRDLSPGEREETAKSSPKGMPCSILRSRLPAREIKRVPGGGGKQGKQTGLGRTPRSFLLLLPLELRQECDPS